MADKPEDEGSRDESNKDESKDTANKAEAKEDAKADSADDAKKADAKASGKDAKPDKKDGVPAAEADIPATRKQEAIPKAQVVVDGKLPAEDPPPRVSSMELHAPLTYPDDGPFAKRIRGIDDMVGKIEQVVLVVILAAIVLTGASHALLERFAHIRIPFKDDVIRSGTFAIAMLGGVFASHQAKHLSMDLLSRRFSPRYRLFLKVTLSLFVIFVLILLIRSGFHNIENERQFRDEDKLITRVRIAYLIPIGGALMIFHTLLHIILDVDYISRNKTPPERMRSGH